VNGIHCAPSLRLVLVICVVLLAFGYSGLPFWPQGKPYDAYFTDAGGISPGNAVYVSGFKVVKCSPSVWPATARSDFHRGPPCCCR